MMKSERLGLAADPAPPCWSQPWWSAYGSIGRTLQRAQLRNRESSLVPVLSSLPYDLWTPKPAGPRCSKTVLQINRNTDWVWLDRWTPRRHAERGDHRGHADPAAPQAANGDSESWFGERPLVSREMAARSASSTDRVLAQR